MGCGQTALQMLDGVRELGFQPRPLISNTAELFDDLVFRPVRIGRQIDIAILLALQLGETALQVRSAAFVIQLAESLGIGEHGSELSPQPSGYDDRRIVRLDGTLQIGDAGVGQVADAVLPATTDVVEVQIAGMTLATHDDQSTATAVTPQHAFQVVVIAPLSSALTGHVAQQPLHAVEDRLLNQRLVPAFVLDAVQGDVTEIEAVGQHAFDDGLAKHTSRIIAGGATLQAGLDQAFA